MAPAKFDDLAKTAKDVLSEDYQVKGTNFKAKLKTHFEGVNSVMGRSGVTEGATITTAIDFDFAGQCATPAKLTWKFPKPLGLPGLAFDKLEVDKAGKMKLEAALDMAKYDVKGLKLECKSDLKSVESTVLGFSYTGIAKALAKGELNAVNPGKYSAEASYSVCSGITVAVKSTSESPLNVGAQYINGPMFFAALGKDSFKVFNLHGYYKAQDDLKLACQYNLGGKEDGVFSAGLAYNVSAGTLFKGKLTGKGSSNLAVGTSVKKEMAKGFNVTAGSNVPIDGKDWTWGMQFSIE